MALWRSPQDADTNLNWLRNKTPDLKLLYLLSNSLGKEGGGCSGHRFSNIMVSWLPEDPKWPGSYICAGLLPDEVVTFQDDNPRIPGAQIVRVVQGCWDIISHRDGPPEFRPQPHWEPLTCVGEALLHGARLPSSPQDLGGKGMAHWIEIHLEQC